ncbi:MAG: TspO/MBR family protein [Alphaproteobacteria bacterium]
MTADRNPIWKPALAGFGVALFVAMVGGLITDLDPWYYSLQQPAWKPPDWLFGPAWTVIFALAALSGIIAWRRAPNRITQLSMVWLFALNGVLNILWSALFFRAHRPDWALAEVILLWLSVLVLIVVMWRYSRPSSWLLVPYLIWVTYAGALNAAVIRLNGPFA